MSVEVALDALRDELKRIEARAEQIAAAVATLQPLTHEQLTSLTTGRPPHQPHPAIAFGTPLRTGDFPEAAFDDPTREHRAAIARDPLAHPLVAAPADPREAPPDPPDPPALTPPAPRREPSTGKGRDGLSEKEQRVLSYINEQGTTSKAAIAKALIEHVSPAYVTQVLSRLVDRELITATGSTSGRRFHSLSPRNEDRPKPKQGPGAAQAAVEDAGVLRCKILDLVKRDPGLTEQQIRLALPPTHNPEAVTVALVKLRGDGKLTLSMGAYRLSASERGVKGGVGSGVAAG